MQEFSQPRLGRVNGIAWLPNRLYVVFQYSTKISVFTDKYPFKRVEKEDILLDDDTVRLHHSLHMIGVESCRSLFLREFNESWIWRIQIEGSRYVISRWHVDGIPLVMIATPFNELLVLVQYQKRTDFIVNNKSVQIWHGLRTLKLSDGSRSKSILLPVEIENPRQVFQTSKDSFVVLHSRSKVPPGQNHSQWLVSEIAAEGKGDIQRTRKVKLGELENPEDLVLVR